MHLITKQNQLLLLRQLPTFLTKYTLEAGLLLKFLLPRNGLP